MALCARCRSALCGAAPRRVRPTPEPRGLPVVHAAAAYENTVRAALLTHKERGALALVGPLGEALAGAVRASVAGRAADTGEGADGTVGGPQGAARGLGGALYGSPGAGDGPARPLGTAGGTAGPQRALRGPLGAGLVLLVPVPSAGRAVRARGHDPVRRVAYAAAGELRRQGMRVRVLTALRQRRAVADQAGLNSRERQANLAGALELAAGAERLLRDAERVVVVDDVMTTGASLAEAARALRSVDGAYGEGDDRASRAGSRAGNGGRARFEVQNQIRNQPNRGTENDAAGLTENARLTGAKVRGKTVSAAVVAASPESFDINRN